MYPSIRLFGKLDLPLYGPCFFIGFALALIISLKITKKGLRRGILSGMEHNDILYASLYAIIGIGIGAKLFFFLSRLPKVICDFNSYRLLWNTDIPGAMNYLFGGLVFYGGLLGAILGIWIYCHSYKISFWTLLGPITPFIPFVHTFGRIGCFLSGCCYGIEYHGPLAVHFPESKLNTTLAQVPRFPVQLLEATLNILLFIVLLYIFQRIISDGKILLGIYLTCYTISRFLLEFLRGDAARGQYGFLSTSQIISLILFPFAAYLLFSKRKDAQRQ